MSASESACYVYVLRCADSTLYTGCARDPRARLARHQAGRAARYTRGRRPVALVALWLYPDRPAALRAERAFKRLDRQQKLAAIAGLAPGGAGGFAPGASVDVEPGASPRP